MNVPLIPATLVDREGVGQDGAGVPDQEGAAHALHDAPDEQPEGSFVARHPVDGQEQRRGGVDDEAEVVHAHPAVHVAQAAEADHEHAAGDQVAEDQPQQVDAVAGHQRVELDTAEDVGHRDDQDRGVDGGQQDARRGVGQRDPLVVVIHRDRRVGRAGRFGRTPVDGHGDPSEIYHFKVANV
jgi:hypothetical protein